MHRTWIVPLALMAVVSGPLTRARALCIPAATPAALEAFDKNPAAWIETQGKSPDLGPVALALAAAAVNANDPAFGKSLGIMLGAASSDQGRVIGHALSGLEASCSDAKDPSDIPDKKYISLNILPNLLSNLSANVAYGEGGGSETTSTGGGGAGGNALVGAGLPEGGANSGSGGGGSTSTPTSGDPVGLLSSGAVGASLLGDDTETVTELIPPATQSNTPGGTGSGSVSTNR